MKSDDKAFKMMKDVYDNDEKKILKTIGKIKKKVERLVKKLEDVK